MVCTSDSDSVDKADATVIFACRKQCPKLYINQLMTDLELIANKEGRINPRGAPFSHRLCEKGGLIRPSLQPVLQRHNSFLQHHGNTFSIEHDWQSMPSGLSILGPSNF